MYDAPHMRTAATLHGFSSLARHAAAGATTGLRSARWLLSIIVPVSFAVFVLEQVGMLPAISQALSPAFDAVGLSGVGALAFVVGILSNLYSVVAIIGTAALPAGEVAVLAVMGLIAHSFPVELAILRRTGSSAVRMFALRLVAAVIAGRTVHLLLPATTPATAAGADAAQATEAIEAAGSAAAFGAALGEWALSTLQLALIVVAILVGLMTGVRLLREYGIIDLLAKWLSPLMRVLGLPRGTSFLWLVCNTLGLTYGSAVLLEEERTGRLDRADGDLLNHHVAISHSMLEDTLIFVAIGVPLLWVTIPRFVLAAAAVWLRRAELRVRRRRRLLGRRVAEAQ